MFQRKLSPRTSRPIYQPSTISRASRCISSPVRPRSYVLSRVLLTCPTFLAAPPPEDVYSDMVIPNDTPLNYTFPLSKLSPTKAPGGTFKVIDTHLFPASTTICAAEVTVEVGGLRYVHFSHPYSKTFAYLFLCRELHVSDSCVIWSP